VAQAAQISAYISLWYAVSISFTFFNKYLFCYWKGGFEFPIATTTVHMTMKYFLSRLIFAAQRQKVPTISWARYCMFAVPIGASTGMDIMLSNLSFLYVTVSFYTIVKVSNPNPLTPSNPNPNPNRSFNPSFNPHSNPNLTPNPNSGP
jgi:solute carrier family 35 protein C2